MKIKYSWPSKQGKYTILVIQSSLIGLSSVIKAYIMFFFFQILQKLIHETCRNPANINKNLEQTNSTDKSLLILA